MIIAYIGNFVPEHSTENHVRTAFTSAGHTVRRVQENDPAAWTALIDGMSEIDLVLWTTTHTYASQIGVEAQVKMLARADKFGVPTVAYHLDRWHGLDREQSLYVSPFFRCDLVITANGGPDWSEIGINHLWLPPAVSLPETELGDFNGAYNHRIAFVGTWRGYHREWAHRAELIDWLKVNFPRDVYFWPRPGQSAIRGKALRDLYATTKVVVGDSCLAGDAKRYWSDRIPETVGRGGFLLHPYVEGLEDHFTLGEHFVTWDVYEWDDLHQKIMFYMKNTDEADRISAAGREHVREHHTYEVRVGQILDAVKQL
jgi:Glycosyl transferases group 1